jgi:uncharacterized protein YkwD
MPKATKPAAFLAALAFSCLAAACGDSATPLAPEPELPAELQDFLSLVNVHRQSVGCEPLAWNPAVAEVAQGHSEDMVARAYFAHYSPEGDSPFDRLQSAGISYSQAAENLAYGYPSGAAVLEGWLNSPGHRANIENCGLSEHGVGLEGTHWTHLFIRP